MLANYTSRELAQTSLFSAVVAAVHSCCKSRLLLPSDVLFCRKTLERDDMSNRSLWLAVMGLSVVGGILLCVQSRATSRLHQPQVAGSQPRSSAASSHAQRLSAPPRLPLPAGDATAALSISESLPGRLADGRNARCPCSVAFDPCGVVADDTPAHRGDSRPKVSGRPVLFSAQLPRRASRICGPAASFPDRARRLKAGYSGSSLRSRTPTKR